MLNGLKPYNYLAYVMEQMKDLGGSRKRKPCWNCFHGANLPADCYSKLKK